MYNIKLELEKNFALTSSLLEVLGQIEQNIQVTQKDATIISDLIKYKLDAYSVFAYLVCEHNIFDKITNQSHIYENCTQKNWVQFSLLSINLGSI